MDLLLLGQVLGSEGGSKPCQSGCTRIAMLVSVLWLTAMCWKADYFKKEIRQPHELGWIKEPEPKPTIVGEIVEEIKEGRMVDDDDF